MSGGFLLLQLELPLGWVVFYDAVDGTMFGWVYGKAVSRSINWLTLLIREIRLVLCNGRGPSRIVFNGDRSTKTLVGYVKNEVVIVVAVRRIIPSDQALVDIIDITHKIRKWLANQFDLWNVSKYLRIGAEINVLVGSFRL